MPALLAILMMQNKARIMMRIVDCVADLSVQFKKQWPRFAASLVGRAGREPLAFQLGGIEIENNVDLSLPRSSKVSIYSPLPDNNSPIEFGWDAKLGPLVVRQQHITANPDDLYTAYLAPGSISAPIPRQGQAAQSTWQLSPITLRMDSYILYRRGLTIFCCFRPFLLCGTLAAPIGASHVVHSSSQFDPVFG